jgi:hypothetical protein
MKYTPLVLLLVLTTSLNSQNSQIEHAPTIEQCQADQRLWLSKLEQSPSDGLPDYLTLSQWNHEMNDCDKVDSNSSSRFSYLNTGSEIKAEKIGRLLDFLERHNLGRQFMEEDAAGKR